MNNLLTLYNPYYEDQVIESHLEILKKNGKVAFGKLKSKAFQGDLKHIESQQNLDDKQAIYNATSRENPFQLFITDYSDLFVAKVVEVSSEDKSSLAPAYYTDKKLEVEQWFLIEDLRELVKDSFKDIRKHLANFKTPSYGDHTFALYGNSYAYPLIVNMKVETRYFEGDSLYYQSAFKDKEFLKVKENLISYSFGESHRLMHPDSMEHIISAEIEFKQNEGDPLYDFSAVVIKYSKAVEYELFLTTKELLGFLANAHEGVASINIDEYDLHRFLSEKASYGTYKKLLADKGIKEAIEEIIPTKHGMRHYFLRAILHDIKRIQGLRNEKAHRSAARLCEVKKLREDMLGLGCTSVISELAVKRSQLRDLANKA